MRSPEAVLVGVLLGLAACDAPTGPDPEPGERFGTVTAVVDGRTWTSSVFPDSIVAFFDTLSTQLQITGQEVRAGIWPTLHFFLRSGAAVGAHHLGSFASVAHAEWLRAAPAARPHEPTEQLQGYISAGYPEDSLVITEFSLATRRIRGRFFFTGAEPHGPGLVAVQGHFAGRIFIH